MDNVLMFTPGRAQRQAAAEAPVFGVGNDALAELLEMLGAAPGAQGEAAAMPVSVQRVRAGEMLFHEGAAAEALRFVRCGSFKLQRTVADGYEQVLGFATRGDVLGFDAICTRSHPTGARALEDGSVFVIRLRDFFGTGPRVSALDTVVHHAASSALAASGDLAEVMAAVAAEARLARFLLQWSGRMARQGRSPRRFHLRMGRRDIASYMGLAHETVSRCFGLLSRWGLVRVDKREVELLEMPALRLLALNTRRPMDEAGPASTARCPAAGRG
jgi:CRP/FNR family transcriptional regulator, anaerobic regulatory protein